MSGKPLEERPQRSMEELIHAVLKDQPVRMQIADNLPEGIQAQYIPKQDVYKRQVCNLPQMEGADYGDLAKQAGEKQKKQQKERGLSLIHI